jgi:small conductance mechanosensitive channel
VEIFGVNELADSAVIIRARLKTKPVLQWGVKREMLRRLKKRFDAEGIEIPFPHQTLYFGVDKDGTAPPGRILLEAERAAAVLQRPASAVQHEPVQTVSAEEKDAARAEQNAAEQGARNEEQKRDG